MKITAFYESGTLRIHKHGCGDLAKEDRRSAHGGPVISNQDFATQRDVLAEFYSDFIGEAKSEAEYSAAEGDAEYAEQARERMDPFYYEADAVFAPCSKGLPRGEGA